MIRRILILSALFVSFAHANVSLHIEHPRNPSDAKDIYKVDCKSKCDIEVKSHLEGKVSSSSALYRSKIKEILTMNAQGGLPQSQVKSRLVMYRIEAVDGKNKVQLVLGYPLSYEGEEFTRYSKVIGLIEEVKRNMKVELMEKK